MGTVLNKSDYICVVPFKYTEVFDNKQFLCCPGWLKEDIYETDNLLENFNSIKAQNIRKSILDGSYKYCDSIQCPHLSNLENNKLNTDTLIPKNQVNLKDYPLVSSIRRLNMCFDRSCNLKCPSCRLDFINYLGSDRISVEDKLEQINNQLGKDLRYLYLSGSADPFYSKSFRQFLINFDSSKFPFLKRIHIHTNGLLWTEAMWSKMHKVHKYVNTCEISIDAATKETYETKTRLGGDWDTLIENLNFIIKIPTISKYIFSFVVQDNNYKEMYKFWEICSNLNKEANKNITVFFNRITNWGTYSDEEYVIKNISSDSHPLHQDFLTHFNKIKNLPNVLHNLGEVDLNIDRTLI